MTRAALPLCLAAAVVAGCADPYAQRPQSDPAPVAGELPAPPIPRPTGRPRASFPTPEAAAHRAAELTASWTGETAAARQAELAGITTGAARRDAQRAAAQLPTDPQLTAPGAGSTATVEAIVRRVGDPRRLLVVTRETLHADGLTQTRFRVYLA